MKKIKFLQYVIVLVMLIGIASSYYSHNKGIEKGWGQAGLLFTEYYKEGIDKGWNDCNIAHNPQKTNTCPIIMDDHSLKQFRELGEISKFTNIKRVFWGDSIVEFVYDGDFYGLNYQDIGHNGQITICALKEVDYIINLNPETVLIYLGGNDVDRQGWYDVETAGRYYEKIIDKLLDNNIKPIIHLINEGRKSRNQTDLNKFNDKLQSIADEREIQVIPKLDILSEERYTYEGEHLKPEGYRVWFEHIDKYVNDFVK